MAALTLCFLSSMLPNLAQAPKFVGQVPSESELVVQKGLEYSKSGTTTLMMDLYTPARRDENRLPVLILFNGFGGHDTRVTPQFEGWSAAATAHGMAAVVEDTTQGHTDADLDALIAYLNSRASDLLIDPERIALLAWSGHAGVALPIIEDPRRSAVKSAAILYSGVDLETVRLDLPLILVRAGLDQAPTNEAMDRMIATSVRSNAPWTVVNYPAGHHGFDVIDDNPISRDIIEQTFAFLRTSMAAPHRNAMSAGIAEAKAASALARGDFAEAAGLYGLLAERRPDDFRVLLAYGNALLGTGKYKPAIAQFERVHMIGGAGSRDLGLPAARACALAGDAAGAIAWLKTIPTQLIPPSVKTEAAFATIRDREDFKSLFGSR